MDSLSINQTMNLVNRIHKDGNHIWHIGAKTILVLPNEAVSIKNKLELIRGLREHGYLQCDETLNTEAYRQFRAEAGKLKRNAERIVVKSGLPDSKCSIAEFKRALVQMNNMEISNDKTTEK